MAYEQTYFTNRKYPHKQQLVERHVLEVLKWATQTLHTDLLDGKGKRALDVGCALGFTTQVLSGLGYQACGVDISSWGTKQAKAASGGDFLVCDAQTALPIKTGTFDLVTCFDVLEHLPDPEKTLLGMLETCKGALVCTTPNRKVEKPIRKLLRDYDQTHISTKTHREWQTAAAKLPAQSFGVESFYDLAVQFGGKLFFKSFSLPTYGLTVRVAVRK
ncbi:MAG: class I SAM-dependent methyltransferase [Candidatus Bathyarchaeota archaeon]|nr:class I SAM-dependent methyltransferase [Chloroflexota bacterium]MCL5877468.1 class I SAM-dependent methyltransferase [Candidatus Bathyarchaeota archaeon]